MRHVLHRFLGMLPAAVAMSAILASCGANNEVARDGAALMKSPVVKAGAAEKTFVERYRLTITLPMQETEFLKILRRLKLDYEVYGQRGCESGIPRPRHSGSVDMAKIQKVYQIYGDIDRVRRVSEMYWAYVDMKNRVVYIENNFAYTGP